MTPTWADSDPNLGWDISGVSSDLVSKNLVSILSSPQSPDASLRDYDNKYALVLNVSQCTDYDATPYHHDHLQVQGTPRDSRRRIPMQGIS